MNEFKLQLLYNCSDQLSKYVNDFEIYYKRFGCTVELNQTSLTVSFQNGSIFVSWRGDIAKKWHECPLHLKLKSAQYFNQLAEELDKEIELTCKLAETLITRLNKIEKWHEIQSG